MWVLLHSSGMENLQSGAMSIWLAARAGGGSALQRAAGPGTACVGVIYPTSISH